MRRRPARVAFALTRAAFLRGTAAFAGALALGGALRAQSTDTKMQTRPIPSSGEALPGADLEAVMRAETLDFVQVNYAVADRAAEKKILPLARDRGMAILVNQPFGGGGLLRALRNKPLPAFAAEIDCKSWAQVLLKFVLA